MPDHRRKTSKIKALGVATAAAGVQAAGLVKAMSPRRAIDAVRSLHGSLQDSLQAQRARRAEGEAPLRLRLAGAADLPALMALHVACGLADDQPVDAPQLGRHWAAIGAAGGEVWLAERGGELLGSLTLYLLPLLGRGGSWAAWADDLAVHPLGNHLGLGRRLLALASERARAAGAYKLALAPRRKPGRHAAADDAAGFIEKLHCVRHGRRFELPPLPEAGG